MSAKLLDQTRILLEQAERALQEAKTRAMVLREKVELLQGPSGLSDAHAKSILEDFLTRAKADDEQWISEDKNNIKYYVLWLSNTPAWVYTHCGSTWPSFTVAQARTPTNVTPGLIVQRALHHFDIYWDVKEHVSEYRCCGM